MADWSMEPAAGWMPCDLQLASWTMQPAACVPGHAVEYASTDVFNSCNQISISVFDGEQQGDYEEVDTQHYPIETAKRECVVDSHNMETTMSAPELINHIRSLHREDVALTKKQMHRYPARIRSLGLRKRHTTPTVVAIGPYYHDLKRLVKAEEMKHLAAMQCIKDTSSSFEKIYSKVISAACVHNARGLYNKDLIGGICHTEFLDMMLFDACFLVQYMLFVINYQPEMEEALSRFFSSNDEYIFYDIMLLENQIPWPIVQAVMDGFVSLSIQYFIYYRVGCLLDGKSCTSLPHMYHNPNDSPHLLGLLRFYIVGSKKQTQDSDIEFPNNDKLSLSFGANQLAEMGMKFTANDSSKLIDMGVNKKWPFSEIFLAPLSLDDARSSLLISMAALEMCTTSNFKEGEDEDSAVCSYLLLLAMLVSTEEDVKKLRKGHILQGAGFTDSEVLDFFRKFHRLRLGKCYVRTMKEIGNYYSERATQIKWYGKYYRNKKTIGKYFRIILGLVTVVAMILAGFQLRSN